MLPAKARLRKSPDFAETLRRGRRAGAAVLVLSVLREGNGPGAGDVARRARVGFVVGRQVGGAVVRNGVRRRLQHLVADRLDLLPAGSRTVIRARRGADRLGYDELGRELDRLLARANR